MLQSFVHGNKLLDFSPSKTNITALSLPLRGVEFALVPGYTMEPIK